MHKLSSNFSFEDIASLVGNYEKSVSGKLVCVENVPTEAVFQSLKKHLEELMRKDILRLALINASGYADGVVFVEKSNWDSEHFGIEVGKIKSAVFKPEVDVDARRFIFKRVKDAAASRGLNVMFARVGLNDPLSIHSLEKEGGILTDVLLTFHIDLKREFMHARPLAEIEVCQARDADEQALRKMAREIFEIDHFHSDPYLPRDKCDELYAKWISSCLNGLVDTVLVARRKGKPVGFITCKVEVIGDGYSYGVIDLMGVEKKHERKGIGSFLVAESLRWFSNHTKSVYVGTQAANIPAAILYEKMGFRQIFSEATLHLWIS